jgi:hypothetical protein
LNPTEKIYGRKNRGYKLFIGVLYIISFIIYSYLLFNYSKFYLTPFQDRPHSQEYRSLRPAGITGHAYGVVGSALMVLMLTYTLRKRVKAFRNMGMLNRWLDIHIFFGIIGPLLIVLHTSFKVQGLVAVSFWSMVAVALSGIFGRYLYLQIPRNIQGDEIGVKELEDENRQYTIQLQREYSLSDDIIRRLEEHDTANIDENTGAVKVLFTIIKHDAINRLHLGRKLGEPADLRDIPREHRKKILRIAHRKSLLNRRILLLNQVQRLFHYWHVVHKPFAIIMYSIMVVHIVVAVWTGYKWIF